MESFARLVLNRIRIGLERLHLLLQLCILLLQLVDVLADGRVFGAPLLVNIHAVLAKNRMVAKEEGSDDHRRGRKPPPHAVQSPSDALRNSGLSLLASHSLRP